MKVVELQFDGEAIRAAAACYMTPPCPPDDYDDDYDMCCCYMRPPCPPCLMIIRIMMVMMVLMMMMMTMISGCLTVLLLFETTLP